MKHWIVPATCLMLASCSSTPIAPDRAAEASSVVQSDYLLPSTDRTQKVIVVHDNVFGPAMIKPNIFIDGQKLGSISQGEKIVFYVTPGVHQLGWSAITKGNYREQEFQISDQLKNVFHLVSPAGDVIRFMREH